MVQISFSEEPEYVRRPREARQSLLTRIVFMTGAASTERGVNIVLVGIAAVAVVLAFVIPVLITPSSHLTQEQRAFINANPPARK